MNPTSSTAAQVGIGAGAMGSTSALAGAIQFFAFHWCGWAVNNDQSTDLAILMYPFVHFFYLWIASKAPKDQSVQPTAEPAKP